MFNYLMIKKKIRFCFIILKELQTQIEDYTLTYEPEDQMEWSLVVGEINAFLEVIF